MDPNDHRSTVYSGQDTDASSMSDSRWMDNEAVVCMYSGVLLSHKRNKTRSSVEMWVGLECVTEREVTQKGRDKYHMLTCIRGI